jgi:hypothetical protein
MTFIKLNLGNVELFLAYYDVLFPSSYALKVLNSYEKNYRSFQQNDHILYQYQCLNGVSLFRRTRANVSKKSGKKSRSEAAQCQIGRCEMALKHARLQVFIPCRFISCYRRLKGPLLFKSIRNYSPIDTS